MRGREGKGVRWLLFMQLFSQSNKISHIAGAAFPWIQASPSRLPLYQLSCNNFAMNCSTMVFFFWFWYNTRMTYLITNWWVIMCPHLWNQITALSLRDRTCLPPGASGGGGFRGASCAWEAEKQWPNHLTRSDTDATFLQKLVSMHNASYFEFNLLVQSGGREANTHEYGNCVHLLGQSVQSGQSVNEVSIYDSLVLKPSIGSWWQTAVGNLILPPFYGYNLATY